MAVIASSVAASTARPHAGMLGTFRGRAGPSRDQVDGQVGRLYCLWGQYSLGATGTRVVAALIEAGCACESEPLEPPSPSP